MEKKFPGRLAYKFNFESFRAMLLLSTSKPTHQFLNQLIIKQIKTGTDSDPTCFPV